MGLRLLLLTRPKPEFIKVPSPPVGADNANETVIIGDGNANRPEIFHQLQDHQSAGVTDMSLSLQLMHRRTLCLQICEGCCQDLRDPHVHGGALRLTAQCRESPVLLWQNFKWPQQSWQHAGCQYCQRSTSSLVTCENPQEGPEQKFACRQARRLCVFSKRVCLNRLSRL